MRTTDQLERDLIDAMVGFQHDPEGYVLYNFPWGQKGTALAKHKGPRTWQRKVLRKIGQDLKTGAVDLGDVIRIARASGHGIGKSALVAWIIKWSLDTFVDARVIITANTENQLKTKTWPELTKWHNLSLTKHWFLLKGESLQSTQPGHNLTWRADAIPWSEKNPESFAGLHNEGKRAVVIFDEASAIIDAIWEVAEGAMTDADTEIIFLAFGNPTRNTGRFRECFRKYRRRWDHEQIDSRAVEGTNLKMLNGLVEDYGEDSDIVKVRVRGMFPSMSMMQMISTDLVDKAYGRQLKDEQYKFAPVIIGVDPGWTGSDPMTIYLRQGLYSKLLRRVAKNTNDMSMAGVIASFEDEYHADAVFIDFGYGTGIVSAGQSMGRNWVGVWGNETSDDLGCLNKRAEMWRLMHKWLADGGAIPADQVIYNDLIGPEIRPTLDGRLKLESKDEMRKRGLPSPNDADALSLTFAHPVKSKTERGKFIEMFSDAAEYYPELDVLEVA